MINTSAKLYNGSLKETKGQYRNCFNNAAKKWQWLTRNGSLICTVMLIWPLITFLFSPTIHANTTGAMFHDCALHSLADLREHNILRSWCSQKKKFNKSTHLLKNFQSIHTKLKFLHLGHTWVNLEMRHLWKTLMESTVMPSGLQRPVQCTLVHRNHCTRPQRAHQLGKG